MIEHALREIALTAFVLVTLCAIIAGVIRTMLAPPYTPASSLRARCAQRRGTRRPARILSIAVSNAARSLVTLVPDERIVDGFVTMAYPVSEPADFDPWDLRVERFLVFWNVLYGLADLF